MSNDPELSKKLLDDNEYEDVEIQNKKTPRVVKGRVISTNPSPTSANGNAKKSASRCRLPCWCTCLVITIGIFVLFALVVLGFAYAGLRDVVQHLTIETDSPKKFPIVDMSPLELRIVKDRITLFADQVAEGATSNLDDLVVTQDEINGFISNSEYLQGHMMITLEKNLYYEEYSLPMDVFGFGGRYFEGNEYLALDGVTTDKKENTIEMKTEIAANPSDWFDGPLFFAQLQYLVTKNEDGGQGVLELFLDKGTFFGQELTVDDHENLLEGLYNTHFDDDGVEYIAEVIKGIGSVSIEEGQIIVKPRRTTKN